MKKTINIIITILIFVSFASFIINGYIVYDDYSESVNRITDNNIYVSNTSESEKTDEKGTLFDGEINILDTNKFYDTIYDDDDDNDGYRERRSYYLDGELVGASWDKNGDGEYDVYMNVKDGLNITEVYEDTDFDGHFDTDVKFDDDGSTISLDESFSDYNSFGYVNNDFDILRDSNMGLCFISFVAFMLFIAIRFKLNKNIISQTLCLLLCFAITFNVIPISYANSVYNEDGTVNNEVFESDWQKYSDIDSTLPITIRSYEVQQYEKAKANTIKYYNQLYSLVSYKEANRLEYIELKKTKSAVVKTHKSNLIKSFIRLSVFSTIQIKDAVGSGSSFADDVLKEGATIVTGIGNIIDTTSNYVTDEYKDSFNTMQKTFSYTTADSILENLKDDLKGQVEEKITDTLDSANLYYTTDDLKISDKDIDILKSLYEANRTLDNAILKNRNKALEIDKKIDEINNKLIEEIANMDHFLAEEKDRVYYLLAQNPPQTEEEPPTLLDESFSDLMDDLTSEDHLDSITFENIDDILEDIPIEETEEYTMIGDWSVTQTLLDIEFIGGDFNNTEDKEELKRQLKNSETQYYKAVSKELDGNVVVLFGENPEPYVMKIDGNNITLSDYVTYSDVNYSATLDFSFFGFVNDERNYVDMTGEFDLSISGNGENGSVTLKVRMELNKD